MRPLLALLILLLTLCTSGLSSVMAAAVRGDAQCCLGEDEEEPARSASDDGGRDECPPLCHECACSPTFAVPPALRDPGAVIAVEFRPALEASSQLPASPPGEGVFHPPRAFA